MFHAEGPTFLELCGITQGEKGTLEVLHEKGLRAALVHYLDGRKWLLLLLMPFGLVVGLAYLGCLLQLLRWLWDKQVLLFFTFLAFVPFYLVLPGPVLMPRYQLPALPLICVMAGLALISLWDRGRVKGAG